MIIGTLIRLKVYSLIKGFWSLWVEQWYKTASGGPKTPTAAGGTSAGTIMTCGVDGKAGDSKIPELRNRP